MKLLHIADLHIGKRVNEFDMLEDQRHILRSLAQIAAREQIDALLIAGDVYDKNQPSAEAVELLDEFLIAFFDLNIPVFMISGNHDSPERLSFLRHILSRGGLYIAGVFEGAPLKHTLYDAHGAVHIHLLPFIKPAMLRPHFEKDIPDYTEAVRAALLNSHIDTAERNVLLAHQFVISGENLPHRTQSENISVGGLDHVDASVFDDFDYVALGHLHRPQRIGRDSVRYAGSPLKYSFSEARHEKSAALIELNEKGALAITLLPLTPLRDMLEIRGPIEALLKAGHEAPYTNTDYIHAILTDEKPVYDALFRLREIYPNLMALEFENTRTRAQAPAQNAAVDAALKSPLTLFAEFYELQNNAALSRGEEEIMKGIFLRARSGYETS